MNLSWVLTHSKPSPYCITKHRGDDTSKGYVEGLYKYFFTENDRSLLEALFYEVDRNLKEPRKLIL